MIDDSLPAASCPRKLFALAATACSSDRLPSQWCTAPCQGHPPGDPGVGCAWEVRHACIPAPRLNGDGMYDQRLALQQNCVRHNTTLLLLPSNRPGSHPSWCKPDMTWRAVARPTCCKASLSGESLRSHAKPETVLGPHLCGVAFHRPCQCSIDRVCCLCRLVCSAWPTFPDLISTLQAIASPD